MEGLETLGAAAGLALIIAFLNSKALKEYYQNWQVHQISKGNGPGDLNPNRPHPLSRPDGRRSPLDVSGRD